MKLTKSVRGAPASDLVRDPVAMGREQRRPGILPAPVFFGGEARKILGGKRKRGGEQPRRQEARGEARRVLRGERERGAEEDGRDKAHGGRRLTNTHATPDATVRVAGSDARHRREVCG